MYLREYPRVRVRVLARVHASACSSTRVRHARAVKLLVSGTVHVHVGCLLEALNLYMYMYAYYGYPLREVYMYMYMLQMYIYMYMYVPKSTIMSVSVHVCDIPCRNTL